MNGFLFFWSMIVITDQVQQAMYHDTMKLIVKLGPIFMGVLPDRIDANEQVSGQGLALAVIKSDDVCEIVMLKVTHVHIKYIIVGTEYYVNIANLADLASGNHFQPAIIRHLVLQDEFHVLCEIPYHSTMFAKTVTNLQLLIQKV